MEATLPPSSWDPFLPMPGSTFPKKTSFTSLGKKRSVLDRAAVRHGDPGGVQQLYGITPDLTCMGKVIGGGLPVGAFGGRSEIMDCLSPLGPVYQAGTLSGNPVARAAGLAQLRELLKGNAYERLEQLGARMEEGIREALKQHGRNYTFHRAGSMFCLFFTEEEVYNLESAQKAP